MARAQARPVRARGGPRRRARRRHVGRGRRDARARHRGGLRRGGPAAGEPRWRASAGRRSRPSSRRSPACRPATATAARSWWPPTATTPRRSGACTSSSARSASRRSGSRRRAAARSSRASSPRIAGGILAPQDGSADPRATVRALAAAAEEVELGVEVHAIEHDGSAVTGVRTSHGRRSRASGSWWPPAPGARRWRPSATGRRCGR